MTLIYLSLSVPDHRYIMLRSATFIVLLTSK
jgi:hypothetical protein